MSQRYLTYSPHRRLKWAEHDSFPKRSVILWRHLHRTETPFRVYRILEGGAAIIEVPESEWSEHE